MGRITEGLRDGFLPAAYFEREQSIDPALQVACVTVGGKVVGPGAEKAAVVVDAVGCSPDRDLVTELVGEHVGVPLDGC